LNKNEAIRSAKVRPVFVVACALLVLMHAPVTKAQSAARCGTKECLSENDAWRAAADIHLLKNEFVGLIRQFAEAAAGTFGDEGLRIASSIAAMEAALDRWDQAVRVYEAAVRAPENNGEIHMAMGSVYLDRNRAADALQEFEAAGRLDRR